MIRRVRGVLVETLAFVLITVLSPVLLPAVIAVDLTLWLRRRKPWMAVRLLAMAWWFLLGELRGLVVLAAIWLAAGGRDTPARRRRVYRLRQSWAAGHLGAVRWLFRLTFAVQGLELVAPGPVLILMRHASIIDNAMPDAVMGRAHPVGLRPPPQVASRPLLGLRFVLKRELRMLPTIDIGGGWVPTSFVHRASGDTERELGQLRRLAIALQGDEGVLIYPEGTRYTAKKLRRAQEVIRERQPEVAPLADRLRRLLPPRLGGPLALLEAAPGVDVVFCGHVGLDGFEYVSDIWAGGLVGTTVDIRFWRHAADSIPAGREARIEWLYAQWQEMDDFVGAVQARVTARSIA